MNPYLKPKVLLLGNGINRCFADSGWSDWIDTLYSEMDLWYLLNRKAREKAEHGTVFFYEPQSGTPDMKTCQKLDLMELFGVEIRDLGCRLDEDEKTRNAQFLPFYHQAIDQIIMEMKKTSTDLRECVLIPPEQSKPYIRAR